MKLTIIGGGGIRVPLIIYSVLSKLQEVAFGQIYLMDNDAEQLALITKICGLLIKKSGASIKLKGTTNAEEALDGADYVITTVREGKEQGRIIDERIALKHGLLGQETTGPGGFALALRNIPSIQQYAELMDRRCPKAWMFNFTNPAGLVTQSLRDAGFQKTIGVCDGANEAQHFTALYLNIPIERVKIEVFGLNHLSWARRVWVNGENILPELLDTDDFLATSQMKVFTPELVRNTGMWMNEYLYYYYHGEKAIKGILTDGKTRGEELLQLNSELIEELTKTNPEETPNKSLSSYIKYNERRSATYMHYARPDAPSIVAAAGMKYSGGGIEKFSDGYASVALNVIKALETGKQISVALIVPNANSINCLAPNDIVEVSCTVNAEGVHPDIIGDVPEEQELLIRSVKRYERLTVNAIKHKSISQAVFALMAHPLVLSYSLAESLVHEIINSHPQLSSTWK